MKLLIDNLDGLGPQNYTSRVDATKPPTVGRKLNRIAEFKFSLVAGGAAPVLGARVVLTSSGGANLFTGYIAQTPSYRHAGWGERGVVYLWDAAALSDMMLLDQKAPPAHPPFVDRNAGDAFRQLVEGAMPGWFDTSNVAAGDPIPYYSVNPAKPLSTTAAEIALAARCCFRDDGGKLFFMPLGNNTYSLAENAASFSPDNLQLQSVNRLVNDLAILGEIEPSAHVKDYFVGDGLTTKFYLSQKPFTRSSKIPLYNRTILDEEYAELDPAHWMVTDPQHAISVSGGQLQVAGGTGVDGQTTIDFIEKIELGGATVMEHGDVVFSGASDGVIGGLYLGTVSIANCQAGFRVTPSGSNCNIQALVGGAVTGTVLATQAGHHYVFTTQLFPAEVYRMQQVFHSSSHPSGEARGGATVAANVRAVLAVHDIDPTNPATQVAPATVLYDGVLSNAPGFCTYALINAANMQCSVAFTYIWLPVDALVRVTPYGGTPATMQTGSLLEGAQCHVSTEPALQFYPEYIPPANAAIEVTYRGQNHALARIINAASIAAHARGLDDGVRGGVREIGIPLPRTSADCETAALALLDDAGPGWTGHYQAWSQFLPGGAADIFPGDALAIDVPSQSASFVAIVREVDLQFADIAGENCLYAIRFVDAADPSLDFAFVTAQLKQTRVLTPIDVTAVGNIYLADLTNAAITNVTSTTVTIDAGDPLRQGGGVEVRYSDAGWGADNNRNLVGRFATGSFTLTRYARAQTYFLRSYDGSTPPKYSRYSTALHVDYPL